MVQLLRCCSPRDSMCCTSGRLQAGADCLGDDWIQGWVADEIHSLHCMSLTAFYLTCCLVWLRAFPTLHVVLLVRSMGACMRCDTSKECCAVSTLLACQSSHVSTVTTSIHQVSL
jgi:hypothetical protein